MTNTPKIIFFKYFINLILKYWYTAVCEIPKQKS